MALPATISEQEQYHIQTDEGPERYFRYQTISGQYRKEKRLEDGTVVGSYGWVDADGYLRMRDYIADNKGYRILKTKNIFVGRNRPIGEAIASSKRTRPSAGTLVETKKVTPDEIKSTTVKYDTATPTYETPSTILDVTPKYTTVVTSSPRRKPSKYVAVTRRPIEIYSTTTDLPYETITAKYSPIRYTPSHEPYVQILPNSLPSTTVKPLAPISSNSLEYIPESYQSTRYEDDYTNNRYLNGPTYPIDRNGNIYTGYNERIGNGYDPQYPYYDGVSVTNDGFRYYLPRQYHEEQNLPGDKRDGSFGYIDPFGIRRVIYYNTAPGTGFQHRKNNRYVGFDATPYDPRPYRK